MAGGRAAHPDRQVELDLQSNVQRARVPLRVLAALALITVAYGVGDIGLRDHQTFVHWWANIGWTLISFLSAAKCFHTARRSHQRHRARAFAFFGAGCASWFLGMLVWNYLELVVGEFTPFPAVSELGFLGLVPPFLLGFYEYGRGERDAPLGLKLVGDYGVTLAAMVMITAVLYYVPARGHASALYVACALGYPVLHFSALSFALVSYWQREWGENRGVLGWLIAAMAVLTFVTTLYAHSLLTNSYEAGHDLDVFWVLGFALVIAGAYLEDALQAEVALPRPREGAFWDALVPSGMLGMVVAVTYTQRDQWSPALAPVFLWSGVLLVASLATRTLGNRAHERALREKGRAQERDLMQAQKLQALGTLAGGIAHDFNNLLSGMLGGVGLLRRMPELNERALSYVDLMEQSMLRAADLSKRLRVLTRAPSGELAPFRPADLVRRVAVLVERGTSGERKVTVEVPDIGTGYLMGDVGLLEQALLNLALNAQHATTAAGEIAIRARLAMDSEGRGGRDGEYLVLSVSDDGCGIPLEHQARVFEPFFTTRSPEEGTGLGLTMVHVAVREHGGFVHLESTPGEGTLVELWIPAVPTAESVVPVELATRALPVGHETVLVVDDRDGPLLASKAILEFCGYRVELAWSAEAALKVVQREPIDLLVTDAVMPHMGGRELLAELRAQSYVFPAILMSGHDEEAAESGDFAATLRKPVDAYALASKVREVLDVARAAGVEELSA